jgi:hypothetical protein
LSHVVYWYGAREECSFYGFVAPKDLVGYQDGINRGYFKPYDAVQLKAAENKKLTKGEQDKLLAINEVNEDLVKQPEQRKRGVTEFPEVFDLLSFDDVESSSSEEEFMGDLDDDDEDDEEEEGEDTEPQRYARKKSYHDSHHANGGKFVHRRTVLQHKTPTRAPADESHQIAIDGLCEMYKAPPSPPSLVTSQPRRPISTDGEMRLSDALPADILAATSQTSFPLLAERLHFGVGSCGYVFANNLSALRHIRNEARNLFHREKELVLSKLSETYRKSFGAMGFYKEHTVLVVSPYSVPPGKLRTMWMDKLAEVRMSMAVLTDFFVRVSYRSSHSWKRTIDLVKSLIWYISTMLGE